MYCGSSSGIRAEYQEAAVSLGRLLAEREVELVYGGGRVGLMGAMADAVLAGGGQVVGVIPRFMVELEREHTGCTTMEVVETMQTRKRSMLNRGDAFVALPGGVGTLEELLEALEWTCSGKQRKPVGLLNVDGLFSPLVDMLQGAVRKGLEDEACLRNLIIAETPAELLDSLERACATMPPCNSDAGIQGSALSSGLAPRHESSRATVEQVSSVMAVLVDDRPNRAAQPASEKLAEALVSEGFTIALGSGAPQGSQAWAVAEAALQSGGRVIGILQPPISGMEHPGLVEQEVVVPEDAEHPHHARKRRLLERSGSMVALPGGIALWDELLEWISGVQLARHARSVAILNTDGFYDPLLQLLEGMAACGFVQQDLLNVIVSAGTPEELLVKLKSRQSPADGAKKLYKSTL